MGAGPRLAAVVALLLWTGMSGDLGAQDPFARSRQRMVDEQIVQRGVEDPRVLEAMREVPRHLFVPEEVRDRAYEDEPLPIGEGQTISQPYIVALMTSLLELDRSDKVLEIGTGSGYQAAVLSRLAGSVFTIEIREGLGRQARRTLDELGVENVQVRIGNGYLGWPDQAPFDAIIVTAAPETLPATLVAQLKLGGRMVIPVGAYIQDLILATKTPEGLARERVVPVRFVPMIGEGADQ